MSIETDISKHLKRIVTGDEDGDVKSYPVMMGKVVAGSQSVGTQTCKVVPTVGDDANPITVLLNVNESNLNAIQMIPADNATVWIAELDGPGKWGVIRCSDVTKMVFKSAAGSDWAQVQIDQDKVKLGRSLCDITVNEDTILLRSDSGMVKLQGTDYGGIPKVNDIVAKLNQLENDINDLKNYIDTHIHGTPSGASLPPTYLTVGRLVPTINSELENVRVKHG